MDMQLFDNLPAPTALDCTHQITMESVRDSTTSLDRATAGAAQVDPYSRTIVPNTRETSTVTSFVPPLAAICFQNNAIHPGAPEYSASPEPVLGDTAGSSFSLTL